MKADMDAWQEQDKALAENIAQLITEVNAARARLRSMATYGHLVRARERGKDLNKAAAAFTQSLKSWCPPAVTTQTLPSFKRM